MLHNNFEVYHLVSDIFLFSCGTYLFLFCIVKLIGSIWV